MANVKTIWIHSSGVPITTGSYDLRTSPYSSPGVSGTHSDGGNWVFAGLDDSASYKLYDTAGDIEVTSITGGSTNTLSFYDVDLSLYLKKAGGTMQGAIDMGGKKITTLDAGTANGDAMRYEDVLRPASGSGTQTIAKQVLFSVHPSATPGTLAVTANGHYTTKQYVDDLFGGVIGVVQSGYMIKLIPSRTTEDAYSKATMEKCNTYLRGLANISTYTGTILVEPLAQASNLINVDDGTTAWIGDGVYIQGVGSKPVINRRAPNSSLTVSGGLINCHILDNGVVSARAYVNFTFENCTFDVPDATDVTFTTCKFKGVNKFKSDAGGELTMSNCTGDLFIYNDDIGTVSISGTQPAQVISTSSSNFDY